MSILCLLAQEYSAVFANCSYSDLPGEFVYQSVQKNLLLSSRCCFVHIVHAYLSQIPQSLTNDTHSLLAILFTKPYCGSHLFNHCNCLLRITYNQDLWHHQLCQLVPFIYVSPALCRGFAICNMIDDEHDHRLRLAGHLVELIDENDRVVWLALVRPRRDNSSCWWIIQGRRARNDTHDVQVNCKSEETFCQLLWFITVGWCFEKAY